MQITASLCYILFLLEKSLHLINTLFVLETMDYRIQIYIGLFINICIFFRRTRVIEGFYSSITLTLL